MAKQIKNYKGFLVIRCSLFDLMQVEPFSLGICDCCGHADFDGYLCCALGRKYYCEKCYQDWIERATRYEEDIPFETEVFESFKNAFKTVDLWMGK